MVNQYDCTLLENPCSQTETEKSKRKAWNSGKAQGKRKKFTPEQVQRVYDILLEEQNYRELAMLTLGIDTSLRSGNMMQLKVSDICYKNGQVKDQFTIIQEKLRFKSKNQVDCVLTQPTVEVLTTWLTQEPKDLDEYLFKSRIATSPHLSRDQHRRYVKRWARLIGLPDDDYSTHSIRRTKPAILYVLSGNDILIPRDILGHSSIKSTQEYLSADKEKALTLAQKTCLFV